MAKKDKFALILAGGGGTRLWPLSRESRPKQLLNLYGDKSLLRHTYDRLSKHYPDQNIFVVTTEKIRALAKQELPNIPTKNLIAEPSSKNTAAAVWLGVSFIYSLNPDAVVSTFAADHYIGDDQKFFQILFHSQEAAKKGNFIITIGISPNHPHTGYGYIQAEKKLFEIKSSAFYQVRKFVEKPDLTTAKKYLLDENYFWNANINSFKASTMLKAISLHIPEYRNINKNILSERRKLEEIWYSLPAVPIDTAVLEKANNVLVTPGEFSWTDIGNWDVLHKIFSNNKEENVTLINNSDVVNIDSKGNLFLSDGGLIATVGLKNMVIIKKEDIFAVFPRDKSEDIKKVVDRLKKLRKKNYL